DCGRLGRNLTNRIFRVRVQTLNVFPFALSRVIYQESIAHSSLRDGSFLEFPRSNSAMCIRKYSSMQRVDCASPGMTEHASCGMKFMSFGRLRCCRSFSERASREKSPRPFCRGRIPKLQRAWETRHESRHLLRARNSCCLSIKQFHYWQKPMAMWVKFIGSRAGRLSVRRDLTKCFHGTRQPVITC